MLAWVLEQKNKLEDLVVVMYLRPEYNLGRSISYTYDSISRKQVFVGVVVV